MSALTKYSKALANVICGKIEDGITIAEMGRDVNFPDESTIHRWQKQYPDFRIQVKAAYAIFFYKMLDEINDLSKELLDIEKDKQDIADLTTTGGNVKTWIYAKRARQDAIKIRIDTLKFALAKLAPKFVEDLKEVPSQLQGAGNITVQIVNYSDDVKPSVPLLPKE